MRSRSNLAERTVLFCPGIKALPSSASNDPARRRHQAFAGFFLSSSQVVESA